MNRGFLIIVGPALLVALVYVAMGWGAKAASTLGLAVLAVAAAVVFTHWGWKARKKSQI